MAHSIEQWSIDAAKRRRDGTDINSSFQVIGESQFLTDEDKKVMQEYRTGGGDCLQSTELEIAEGRATGSLVNNSGLHALPAIIDDKRFFSYDDDLNGNTLIFCARNLTELLTEVGNYFQQSYGREFSYMKGDVRFNSKT